MSATVGADHSFGSPESDSTNISVNLIRRNASSVSPLDQLDLLPSMITADAVDLIDCEVASTCGSDTDPVVLFDVLKEPTSWVMGVNVLIRNLHPDVCAGLIDETLKSRIGIQACSIHCPSFRVARMISPTTNHDEHQPSEFMEFNFGFAVISLSHVDEATTLNYIIDSDGGVDEFFLSSPPTLDGVAECTSPLSAAATCNDDDDDGGGLFTDLSYAMTPSCNAAES